MKKERSFRPAAQSRAGLSRRETRRIGTKRALSLVLCLLMILCITTPLTAHAQESEQKVVRVGWYESTYCYRDQYGQRRGIAYEYQRRIAAHTGWTYEYVEDSWPNLMQMLIDGKLDLLSDVSYKEERAALMLYPALAMGAESYYVYMDADNTEIKNLAQAKITASVDALTGVKNRHAYLMAEERLNTQIAEERAPAFAVVVLDVNDLKTVNDSLGHDAGDQYLRDACKVICDTFKHSPVFRIGGDEFAVIAQGGDYDRMAQLMEQMRAHNDQALQNGGIVIACGMARRADNESVASVFERADQNMYENKSDLKARKNG